MVEASTGMTRSVWKRLHLGPVALGLLIVLNCLPIIRGIAGWSSYDNLLMSRDVELHVLFFLVPGLLIASLWPTRLKWLLLAGLVATVVVFHSLLPSFLRAEEDRGVRRDIPALEEAWERYQAGPMSPNSYAGRHWWSDHEEPLMSITWGGFIDSWYGSVYVPEGSRPLCEQKTWGCWCREIEPRFYFCMID